MANSTMEPDSGQRTASLLPDVLAGLGVGVVVGIIAGLSISHVVSIILGALSTGLLALLGLTGAMADRGAKVRTAAFGITCALSLLLGVAVRSHSWLGPNPSIEMKRWTDTGMSPNVAEAVVLEEFTGGTVTVTADGVNAIPDKGEHAPLGGLMNAPGPGICSRFLSGAYKSADTQLNGLDGQDGTLASFAKALRAYDADRSNKNEQLLIDAALQMRCSGD